MQQKHKQPSQTIGWIITNINLELESLFNKGKFVTEIELDSIIKKYGIHPKFFKGRSHIAIEIDEVLQVKAKRKNVSSQYEVNKRMSYTQLIIVLKNTIPDAQSKTYQELMQVRDSIKDIKKQKCEAVRQKRLDNFLNVLDENGLNLSQFKDIAKAYESLSYAQKTEL